MQYEQIENEIRRLAPWYYLYDLHGIRTDITAPFDDWGHRSVEIPDQVVPYLQGKTILDVGCNEGGYAFTALKRGAGSVLGIDCRPVNVEKANFVARVLGIENATFQVGSADSWSAEHQFDIVFLCGLIYHLPEPWNAVGKFCSVARQGILVTTMLRGGFDGYSPSHESDSIGACENPAIPSMTPNTVQTVVAEFAKHKFVATFVIEWKFHYPSSFSLFGWRISRHLNRTRVAFLNGISALLNRIRGYSRIYLDSVPESPDEKMSRIPPERRTSGGNL
jgi:SAM-dependent methyltransferase